jgi:hypothetical protein
LFILSPAKVRNQLPSNNFKTIGAVMKYRSYLGAALVAVLLLFVSESIFARGIPASRQKSDKKSSADSKKPGGKSDSKEKPYAELTKDKVKVDGLFTFYLDTLDNSVLMEIKPEHIGPYYLCNTARATSDGTYYDTGPPGRSFPFYFKRIGKNILLMEKNLRVRADSTSTMRDVIAEGISDHLYGSVEIKSAPHDSTKGVLVDPASFFIADVENTGYYLGQIAKSGFGFDSKNSYFSQIKSFPNNSEIDVMLHFKSSKPNSGVTLQSGDSFFHKYHFSLSTLPVTDYVPRLADSRIGNFVTMYQDYSGLGSESPYVRYLERWNLKKKNPEARISEPVEPIVYWIENTVPHEYRDAIAEGIEFWNQSFERIGFRNAVVAKQMEDTATWDPLDTRYSTVRWIYSPGVYAIGPSRANPFTGQIYDADIGMSSDFVRAMYNNMENFIKPVSFDGMTEETENLLNPGPERYGRYCTYASELAQEAAFGLAYLYSTAGDLTDKDSLTKAYVHAYLVEVIAHEVGHTLGFRHNFKASTIHTLEQINDPEFTKTNGTVGTVMEYAPPNIAGKGKKQGEFFASTPGPYDNWIVEFAYSDFGAKSPAEELEKLNAIAARSAEPQLAYCTDFDMNQNQIDPLANYFDLGNDPLRYCHHKVDLTRELWLNSIKEFEKPGVSYEKIKRVFQSGWRSYVEGARFAAAYIGGLNHNKNFIGDNGGSLPFNPVPAGEQRRAMQFLRDRIFAADAFSIPAELLNKLQPERNEDFSWSIYSSPLEYPWHQSVMSVQNYALVQLYSPRTIGRLLNNEQRVSNPEERYSMYDLFTDTRRAIWGEITTPSNVNSYRRQLQLAHLNRIVDIYLSNPAVYPSDARTLAANDLDILENAARTAAGAASINEMSRAHYKEVGRQIAATKKAGREYEKF